QLLPAPGPCLAGGKLSCRRVSQTIEGKADGDDPWLLLARLPFPGCLLEATDEEARDPVRLERRLGEGQLHAEPRSILEAQLEDRPARRQVTFAQRVAQLRAEAAQGQGDLGDPLRRRLEDGAGGEPLGAGTRHDGTRVVAAGELLESLP